jgi:uncharacterized protein with von Willebrand factor type A (vWA) domain
MSNKVFKIKPEVDLSQVKKLNTELDKTAKNVEEVDKEFEKVGDEIQDVNKELKKMNDNLNDTDKGSRGLSGFFDKAKKSATSFGNAGKSAITALGGAIGGIGAALAVAGAAFARTTRGAEMFRAANVALNVGLDMLGKKVEQLVGWFDRLFKDPQTAVRELGNVIMDSLVVRFNAIISMFTIAGEILNSISQRNYSDLKKLSADLAKSFGTAMSGINTADMNKTADKTTKSIYSIS